MQLAGTLAVPEIDVKLILDDLADSVLEARFPFPLKSSGPLQKCTVLLNEVRDLLDALDKSAKFG